MSIKSNLKIPSYGLINSVYRAFNSGFHCLYYLFRWALTTDPEAENKYQSLGKYYKARSRTIDAYSYFGEKLLYPATNFEKQKTVEKPISENKAQKIYNKAVISLDKFILSEDYSKTKTNAVCFCLSMNFISKFFKEKKEDDSILDTLVKICPKFEEGSSEKIAMMNRLQKVLKAKTKLLWSVFTCEAANGFMQMINDSVSFQESLVLGSLWHYPFVKEITTPALETNMGNLKDGVYQVIGGHPDRSAHAIVYIKEGKEGYFFDPNLGTVKIPPGLAAQYLSNCFDYVNCKSEIMFFKASSKSA